MSRSCIRRGLALCALACLLACPALGESPLVPQAVGQTGDLTLMRLEAPNGQALYYASLAPESPYVAQRDLNGDGWMDLAVITRAGAANSGFEFFLWDGQAYTPVQRLMSAEEAFYNYTLLDGGRYLRTQCNNGFAGALFDAYLYAWEGADVRVMRRAVSELKTDMAVADDAIITTQYQNIALLRVWDYANYAQDGTPTLLYQQETDLTDPDAASAAYEAALALLTP